MVAESVAPWLAGLSEIIAEGLLRLEPTRVRHQRQQPDRGHLEAPVDLAHGYAAVARHPGDALAQKAIRLALAVEDPIARAEVLGGVGVALLAKASTVAAGDPLYELLIAARHMPTDCQRLADKARCLALLARASAQLTTPSEIGAVALARYGATVAARSTSTDVLRPILGDLFVLVGGEHTFVCVIEHLAQQLVDDLKANRIDVQRDLARLVTERGEAAVRGLGVGPMAVTDVIAAAIGWFEEKLLRPYFAERHGVDAMIRAYCLDELEPDAAQAELLAALEAGTATTSVLLAPEQLSDPRASAGRIEHLDWIDRDVLGELLTGKARRARADPPLPPVFAQSGVAELMEARARYANRIRGGYTRVCDILRSDDLQIEAARPDRLATLPAELRVVLEGLDVFDAANGDDAVARTAGLFATIASTALDPGHRRLALAHLLPRWEAAAPADPLRAAMIAHLEEDWGGLLDAAEATMLAHYLAAPERILTMVALGRCRLGVAERAAYDEVRASLRQSDAFQGQPMQSQIAAAVLLTAVGGDIAPQAAARLLGLLEPELLAACCLAMADAPEIAARVFANAARVTRIEISGNGATVSTLPDCLRALVRAVPDGGPPAPACNGEATTDSYAVPPDDQDLWREPWACRGRTLIYKGDHYVAYKLQRRGESVSTLRFELQQQRRKRAESTASLIPEALAVVEEVAIPDEHLALIAAAGIELAPVPAALVYRCDDAGLWSYANEATDAERVTGIERCAQDLFAWMRRGEADMALTVKNHNIATEGARRYEWMIDLCVLPAERRGMGRIDRVDAACEYPNVRATGVADLAEMRNLDEIIAEVAPRGDNRRPQLDPIANLCWFPPAAARRLHTVRILGDYLLDLTLLVGDAYRRAGKLHPDRGDAEQVRADIAEELQSIWTTAFVAFTEAPQPRATQWVSALVDFERLATQMAYFLEPAAYAASFDATVIFDPTAPTDRPRGEPHRENTAHLAAALAAGIYGGRTEVAIDITDKGVLKRWVRPVSGGDRVVYGFCSDDSHHDLGCYNGPSPLVELERGLYLVPVSMLLFAGHRSDIDRPGDPSERAHIV